MYIFTESVYVQIHGNKVLEGTQDVYTDTVGPPLIVLSNRLMTAQSVEWYKA